MTTRSFLASLRCRLGQHIPTRRRVNWDGIAYCSTCANCGRRIRGIAHRRWRADHAAELRTES
ncbi:MAG: hypothetical protein ACO25F_02070 [Erythrobacter sp.]